MTHQEKAKLYPFIAVWGSMMGSYSSYIEQQLDKAIATQAPYNATYLMCDSGKWQTIEGFTTNTHERVKEKLAVYKRALEIVFS